jgi:hypothetical protein
VHECPKIETLPEGLTVIGNIDINRCDSFTHLPDRISAADLHISSCENFDFKIPNRLSIDNSLIISFKLSSPTGRIFKSKEITNEKVKEEIREKLGKVSDVNVYPYTC